MDIKIYGENVEITPAMQEHIYKKCEKFNALVGSGAINVRLKIDEQKNSVAKLDVHYNGKDLHLDAKDKDMYTSITNVANKTHKLLNEKNHKNKPMHIKMA